MRFVSVLESGQVHAVLIRGWRVAPGTRLAIKPDGGRIVAGIAEPTSPICLGIRGEPERGPGKVQVPEGATWMIGTILAAVTCDDEPMRISRAELRRLEAAADARLAGHSLRPSRITTALVQLGALGDAYVVLGRIGRAIEANKKLRYYLGCGTDGQASVIGVLGVALAEASWDEQQCVDLPPPRRRSSPSVDRSATLWLLARDSPIS